MNVMEMFKTSCFRAAIRWHRMGTAPISTMVPPIRALRWRTAVFAVLWPGWMRMVIRNKLTIDGSGKVSAGCYQEILPYERTQLVRGGTRRAASAFHPSNHDDRVSTLRARRSLGAVRIPQEIGLLISSHLI